MCYLVICLIRLLEVVDRLKVFKPDKVVIDGKDVKVLVGISDVNYKGVNIILNKEAL